MIIFGVTRIFAIFFASGFGSLLESASDLVSESALAAPLGSSVYLMVRAPAGSIRRYEYF